MPIILDGTNGAFLPTWTTATRPASPANGEIGYNSTTAQLDQYVGGAWSSVPTGSASAATPTALGTVYAKQTTGGGSPYLTAFGSFAATNTTGANNTAMGNNALFTNVSGASNCAFGLNALYSTTGNSNVGIGEAALQTNNTGINNTAVGNGAGFSSTTDSGIVAIGHQALYSNTTGSGDSHNVAVGRQAMYTNSIGYYSVAVGYRALYAFNANGGYNVAVGYQAMAQATTASSCTATGYRAGYGLTGGSGGNTFYGYNAGSNITTGSYNTFLGTDSSAAAATDGSEIVIGNNSVGKGSNTAFINPNSGGVYAGNNSSNFSTTSDQRLKKNIVDNNEGLDKITAIRIRNFEYRLPEEVTELPTHSVIKKSGIQLGVIAQELQAVLPDCVKEESTGVLTVDSDNLTWYLINAVKELKAELDALKAKVA